MFKTQTGFLYKLKVSATAAAFLTGVAGAQLASAQAADPRPNILLIVADDLGWTDIGSYGSEIDTPHLDQLAELGMRFTDYHVSISCSPTRSMLMSGTDNHIAGLGAMAWQIARFEYMQGQPGYEGYLNERMVTVAEVLQSEGYHTYMAGKWHLGDEPGRLPGDRGFEKSFALLPGMASHFEDRTGINERASPVKYSMNGALLDELPPNHFSSRSFTDFVIDSMRENMGDGKPFLTYLAFQAPHDPVQVPDPWATKYKGRYDDGFRALKEERAAAAKRMGLVNPDAPLPAPHPAEPDWSAMSEEERAISARGMEVFAGQTENMDYHIGRVISYLKDVGEYDNTIIFFMSDNGANPWYSANYPGTTEDWLASHDNSLVNLGKPGSHHAYGPGWAHAGSGPLGMFKMTVAQGGIRSPLIVAGPGIVPGEITDAFAYVIDIKPTILDMIGAEHPDTYNGREVEPMLGRSLMGVLSGSAERAYGPDEVMGGEMVGNKWIRRGDYKALLVPPPYGDGQIRLYNVAEDPGETRDLSAEMPDLLQELVAAWDEKAKEVGVVQKP